MYKYVDHLKAVLVVLYVALRQLAFDNLQNLRHHLGLQSHASWIYAFIVGILGKS